MPAFKILTMKYILTILLCLFGTAYGQTIGYLRYDTVKIFTTKPGGRGSLDVTGNVRFTGLLQKSAGTDSVVVRDVNGNLGTTAKGALVTTIPISSLLAATVTNSINNGNFTQTWNWPTLTSGALLINAASTAMTNSSYVFAAVTSGVNATNNMETRAAEFQNTHSGTGSTNNALYLIADNGATNNAIYVATGNVNLQPLTATTILGLDGSKNIKSVALSGLTYDGTTLTATGAASTVPINGLLAATGTNSIDNTTFGQTWSWTNATTGLLNVGWNSTTKAADSYGVAISALGTNATSSITSSALAVSNTSGGTGAVNNGLRVTASGGATNNAIYVTLGNVNIQPLTASQLVVTDVSKNLASSAVGTGVLTALGVNVGSAGAFVVNGGALGTPSSGTVTNLTGTASININGTVGATTPTTGAFTTSNASTSMQTPAINGGTVANDDITVQGTTSATRTTSYVNLQPSGGLVGIGISTPLFRLDVKGSGTEEHINIQGSGTGSIKIGTIGGTGEFGAMWAAQASPTVSNYAFLGNASFSIFNVPSGGSINFRVNNADQMVISSAGALRLNAYGAGTLVTDGSGNVSASSDINVKHSIKPFKLGLNEILKVVPSNYIRNSDATNTVETGFIAQNIRDAFGGLGVGQDSNGNLTLNNNVILAAAVNAIRELNSRIEALENEVKRLKK